MGLLQLIGFKVFEFAMNFCKNGHQGLLWSKNSTVFYSYIILYHLAYNLVRISQSSSIKTSEQRIPRGWTRSARPNWQTIWNMNTIYGQICSQAGWKVRIIIRKEIRAKIDIIA